ncbi:MAG: serine hydrolase [Gemmatimonadota bacterium]|nr:MAG: serine hydrolase [Gemmatimonadota bacterium]
MKALPLFALLSALTCTNALAPGSALAQTQVAGLTLGQPIEKELAGRESHSYSVDLEAGQFMFAAVDQRGIDVTVTVFGPDGEQVGWFDTPNGSYGIEGVGVEAEVSGAYRLEVQPFSEDAEQGRYAIELERLQAAATTPEGKIDQLFLAFDRLGSAGAAVAVVKDGEAVYQRGFGYADLEHGVAITPSTVFDIASVSKQFAGIAIAMLVKEGRVDLDADYREYLPEMPEYEHTVTVRHLVHHTSGIRDWSSALPIAGVRFEDVISFDDILRMAKHMQDLNYTPGDRYSYTNTGYNLLAEIVSRVTGEPFADWMEANVFEPLGMENTHFQADHDKIVANKARSYRANPSLGFQNVANNLTAIGSSSLYTTTEDLARWVLNFEGRHVGGEAVKLMLQQGVLNNGTTIGYAFGQGVGSYKGARTVSHGGSWAGFRTQLLRFPDQRFAVIVLGNFNYFNPSAMANAIADIYLFPESDVAERTSSDTDAPEVVVDPAILDDYIGTYRLGPGWLLTITHEDGRLMAQATNEDKFPMKAVAENRFWVADYGASVFFPRNPAGEVTHLGYRGIRAPRVELFTPGPDELEEFAGSYYSVELDTRWEIIASEGALVARHRRYDDIPLDPGEVDDFTSRTWFLRHLKFSRDEDGGVSGFLVTNGRVQDLRFDRVE